MTTIRLPYTPHLTSDEVRAEIEAGDTISNGAAFAIASWWQSPRGYGYTFAMLASTNTLIVNDLRDSIRHEWNTCQDADARAELEALRHWVDEVAYFNAHADA